MEIWERTEECVFGCNCYKKKIKNRRLMQSILTLKGVRLCWIFLIAQEKNGQPIRKAKSAVERFLDETSNVTLLKLRVFGGNQEFNCQQVM